MVLRTYHVSSVLGSVISCCFSNLIGRADGLLVVAHHSGREGEGEGGIVSLAGIGRGKREDSCNDQEQHLAINCASLCGIRTLILMSAGR